MAFGDYRERIEKEGVIAFAPTGNSMWPTLKGGKQSVIVVKKPERLKSFDCALYNRKDGTYVLHRVIKPVDGGYIFCGDSLKEREFVPEEMVFGIMAGYYKGKKYIDVNDVKFIKKSEKLYKNEKKRLRRARVFFIIQSLKRKIKKLLKPKKRG